MDTEQSVARSSRTDTLPEPEDHAQLLAAAKAADAWFVEFDEHAPEGLHFGGESKVRRQLHQAIRLAS